MVKEDSPFNVLSIDFDYWFPGDQPMDAPVESLDQHCGRCFRHRFVSDYDALIRPCVPYYPAPGESEISTGDHQRKRGMGISDVVLAVPRGSVVWVAESHADILGAIRMSKHGARPVVIYGIDHHDDDGPLSDVPRWFSEPGCPSWITHGKMIGMIHRFYGIENDVASVPRPDLVFVCKSSPYLLEDGDGPFNEFLLNIETMRGAKLRFTGWVWWIIRRDYIRFKRSRELTNASDGLSCSL